MAGLQQSHNALFAEDPQKYIVNLLYAFIDWVLSGTQIDALWDTT